MHGLDVIIARNEYTNGRAAAHAVNDRDFRRFCAIVEASTPPGATAVSAAFSAGYKAGEQEG